MAGKSLVTRFAETYGVEANKLLDTLKRTVFREANTNEEFMSLLVVAEQYKLNPFIKEIFAFRDKRGNLSPIVSIDGWLGLINSHPQFNGMDISFSQEMTQTTGTVKERPVIIKAPEYCTVTIYRKDREHPTVLSEYFEEVFRNTDPWRQSPRRMLRHKTIIQCGRVAFGFSGIYEQDEAERISDARIEKPATGVTLESLKTTAPPPENQTVVDTRLVASDISVNAMLHPAPEWPKYDEHAATWVDSDGVLYHPDVHVNGDPPPVTQAGCFRARRNKSAEANELAARAFKTAKEAAAENKSPAPADTAPEPDAGGEDPPWTDSPDVGDSSISTETI